MGINRFFEDILGARRNHPVQSWGAINPDSKHVFLTVWQDQIKSDGSGERVQIYNKKSVSKSFGRPERLEHLEAIKNGAQGFGVVCIARDPHTATSRNIAYFETSPLLQLGDFTEDENHIYAHIVGRIPTNTL